MSREQLLVTSDVHIYSVYHDAQDNNWLCTSIGLIQVSARQRIFANYFTKSEFDKAGNNQVRGIYVDPTGSANGGEQIYANVWRKVATAPQIPLEGNNEEFSLIPLIQHANHLYFGDHLTLKNGTNVIQKVAFDHELGAWALYSLNDSLVLRGSSLSEGGIFVLNTRTGKSNPSIRSIGSIPMPSIVYRFVLTQKKGIVALAGNGVFRLDSDWNISEYWGPEGDAQHRLPISEFYDLHEDKQGVCWLATANQGLFRWEWNATAGNSNPVVRQFAMSEGLPALRLYRIEEDDRENLWVSTYNGLMRFDKKNFSAFNFYAKDGLAHNEFNRVSSFKASDGKMYFGGVNGLNAFDPKRADEVYFNQSFPLQLLSIQRFSDESDSLVSMLADWYKSQSLTISQADRFLAVDFALLDYAQRPHRYAYMLEGVDTEWNIIVGGSVRISHLSYGNYTLRVKAQLENGQWNEQELRIPITVLVPFYLRWSFWLVFLAALVVVVWLYAIWRTRRLERQNRRLEMAVEERTKSLSKALKDRELLLMEIHHRVKNNLQIVSDLLQLQKDEMDDPKKTAFISDGQSRVVSMALIHQNLYQNSDLTSIRFDVFLQSLTSQIAELYSADQRSIKLELKGAEFFLDIDTAIPLGLITNELITNSYKYAFNQSNVVKILVDLESLGKGAYKMTYKDFGSGLPQGVDVNSSKSLGMRLIYGLTHQLSGEIHYSNDGGSVFEITFNDSEFRAKE
jgi:two-component sensor histidine kinase